MTIQASNNEAQANETQAARDGLGYLIGSLSSALRTSLEKELAPLNVGPAQWAILEACAEGEANTLTGLARIIPVDAASISRQIDKLVKSGLVRRRRMRTDRRSVRVDLTDVGRELAPKVAQRVRANNIRYFGALNETERAAFTEMVRRMLAYAANEGNPEEDESPD